MTDPEPSRCRHCIAMSRTQWAVGPRRVEWTIRAVSGPVDVRVDGVSWESRTEPEEAEHGEC